MQENTTVKNLTIDFYIDSTHHNLKDNTCQGNNPPCSTNGKGLLYWYKN